MPTQAGKWVPYNRISNNLKRAVIASEDANFSEHDGVDWEALQKAYERNNKKPQGGRRRFDHHPAIGQEPVPVRLAQLLRKGQELIITYMLETLMDKERIFEIYLNVVEFGTGTFGAEAASRHYYGVSAPTGRGPGRAPGGDAAQPALLRQASRFYLIILARDRTA
jgi:monofunctional biosynthetic peptidoglycan transglycosylase